MATTLGNTFVSGTPLILQLSTSTGLEPCRVRSRVTCENSTAYNNNPEQVCESQLMRQGGVQNILKSSADKPKSLWWAPLFNVSADSQWINIMEAKPQVPEEAPATIISSAAQGGSTALPDLISQSPVRTPKQVTFTPEKARALRRSLRASETWHDGWYHSAIATRLAEPEE